MQARIPPPAIGLAAALAMWWVATRFPVLPFAFPGQLVLAGALGACGLLLDVVSVAAFFRARTTVNPLRPERTQKLVVRGFYRFSRNPMYLGMLLILTGVAVYLGEALNAIFLALFVLLINAWQIVPEERALAVRFGQDYRDYCARVRRWL